MKPLAILGCLQTPLAKVSPGCPADFDGDGIIDVADNNPFDRAADPLNAINTNVASPTPIAAAPNTSRVFL